MGIVVTIAAWAHGRNVGRRETLRAERELGLYESVPSGPAAPSTFKDLALLPLRALVYALSSVPKVAAFIFFAWVLMLAGTWPFIWAVESGSVLPLLLYIPIWLVLCMFAAVAQHTRRED